VRNEALLDDRDPPNGRLALDQLANSPELLRAVVDGALAAVVTMDEDGLVTGWGARAQQTFGWSAGEMVGRVLADVIIPEQHRAAHNAGLARYRSIRRGRLLGKVLELSALRRNGEEFPVELAISHAAEVDGRTVFIAFIQDISDRKEAERIQADLLEQVRSTNEAMRDFSNLMAHELRAPLTVISGYSEMLVEGSLKPGTTAWNAAFAEIKIKTQEALALVEGLLLSSRLEASALTPDLRHLDLRTEARSAVERASASARLAGADVQLEAGPEPCIAIADAEMAGRIIDNLIQNALAYGGSPARVRIQVQSEPEPTVSVEDAGNGVPQGLREAIFRRFVRADDRASASGTGLGLYLSRQLAKLQGGSLKLDWSEEGRGSRFSLRLPSDRRLTSPSSGPSHG
jgi:PAS domain S-box-containing protein